MAIFYQEFFFLKYYDLFVTEFLIALFGILCGFCGFGLINELFFLDRKRINDH